ncbi:hypothetical protein [Microbacterium excoecariae]|uniref:hypothetical protein n=1 Tax=Microbacterium excoecariae TaxID=2715210 RepID=UPI00140C6147|nr:hypothetical protein [Microbacterium excoecariae]NHI16884.1 hypothetical protein [Microbacterium excoecariae]
MTINVIPAPDEVGRATGLADISAARVDFNCYVQAQYPHGSTHVSGTINVVVTTKCDVPVARMRLAAELYRISPYARYVGVPKVDTDVISLKANAATSCSAGPAKFQGLALATIQPPAGFKLRGSPSRTERGLVRSVACGQAFAAADAGGGDIAESWTLNFVRADAESD